MSASTGWRPNQPTAPRLRTGFAAAAAGGLALFFVLLLLTRSFVAAAAAFIALLLLGVALRVRGLVGGFDDISRRIPRPWRGPSAIVRVAASKYRGAFAVGVGGTLFAPSHVEVLVSQRHLVELWRAFSPDVVLPMMHRDYLSVVREYGAVAPPPHPQLVSLVSAADVADGVVIVRAAATSGNGNDESGTPSVLRSAGTHSTGAADGYYHDGHTSAFVGGDTDNDQDAAADYYRDAQTSEFVGYASNDHHAVPAPAVAPLHEIYTDSPTSHEPQAGGRTPVPPLLLHTDGQVVSTLISPASAGRGRDCALRVVTASTISRKHLTFTFGAGSWWVECVGMNGAQLNGDSIRGRMRVSDEDVIRWGGLATSPVSVVQIGTA